MESIFAERKKIAICLLLAVAVIVTVFAPMSVKVSSAMAGRRDVPILNVDTNVKCVALTMNLDKYINIQKLREVLGNEKMTFFTSRYYQSSYEMDLVRLRKDGHSIGIYDREAKGRNKYEVRDLLKSRTEEFSYMTGSNTSLVRFEGYDSVCIRTALDEGFFPIQHSCDDSAENFSNGDIVLVSDIENLKKMIERLKSEDYTLVTVDELIYREDFSITLNGTQVLNNNQ